MNKKIYCFAGHSEIYDSNIKKANQYMVDNSQCMICYVRHSWGGAAKTLEYAKRKKDIEIFNVAPHNQ